MKFLSLLSGSIVLMHATSYGTFPSPITADLLAKHSTQIRQVLVEHDDVYWLEMRPSEKGRITLTSLLHKDILPDPYFVRTQVHEYGGKCSLFHDGTFYFSHSDHALYKMTGTVVTRITNAPTMRFADFVIHPNGKWLFAVCEDHKEKEVKNSLVKIHIDTGTIEPLASAHDFYMAPRLSPNGGHLAYIAWDHPNMPWDKTELWISDLNASG